jgi:hypothetical protein
MPFVCVCVCVCVYFVFLSSIYETLTATTTAMDTLHTDSMHTLPSGLMKPYPFVRRFLVLQMTPYWVSDVLTALPDPYAAMFVWLFLFELVLGPLEQQSYR